MLFLRADIYFDLRDPVNAAALDMFNAEMGSAEKIQDHVLQQMQTIAKAAEAAEAAAAAQAAQAARAARPQQLARATQPLWR